ncbi:hypothetical protein Tco_0593574 [Tanacetum coccineum]
MNQDRHSSTQISLLALKIPIIKKGEYDIWSMRMGQYICHTDHNLWDIIINGDLQEESAQTGDQSGPSAPPVPKTAKQLATKRNQEREAIKSRFGGMKNQKDAEDIDDDDLEELDLRWQVAMLTIRVKKFIQKTGKNLDFKEKRHVSLDKSNCVLLSVTDKGTLLRECRSERIKGARSTMVTNGPMSNAQTNESSSKLTGGSRWSRRL